MPAILRQVHQGEYQLQGSLTLQSVVRLLTQSEMMFHANGPSLKIDMTPVNRVESAGLALLVEWRRRAQAVGKTIHYQNIPAQLIDIARLSGVAGILEL
jgi:phospholipid transport system transporter-binding protein